MLGTLAPGPLRRPANVRRTAFCRACTGNKRTILSFVLCTVRLILHVTSNVQQQQIIFHLVDRYYYYYLSIPLLSYSHTQICFNHLQPSYYIVTPLFRLSLPLWSALVTLCKRGPQLLSKMSSLSHYNVISLTLANGEHVRVNGRP